MSDKKLSLLAIAAVISVILAVFVVRINNTVPPVTSQAGYLIQGLDPSLIAEIASVKGQEKINLKRRDGNFVVAQKAYYPAMGKEVNQLITACLDMRTVELYTEDKANHKDLGVTDDSAFGVIRFLDFSGELITGVVIGNSRSDGTSYARLIDSNEVYVIANAPWVKPKPMDFIDSELVFVNKDNISSVTITSPKGSYAISSDNGKAVLQQLPVGKRQKDSDCEAVFSAMTNLRFEDVISVTDNMELDFGSKYTLLLADSTLYTVSIAKKDDKTYVKCFAEFTDKTPVQKAQGVESEEELKKKEAKLLAKQAAKEFELKCKDWVYQLPKADADNLTKPLAELIEEIPADAVEINQPQENEI